jgi:hypothetical protein
MQPSKKKSIKKKFPFQKTALLKLFGREILFEHCGRPALFPWSKAPIHELHIRNNFVRKSLKSAKDKALGTSQTHFFILA